MSNTHRRSYNLGTIVMDREGITKVKTKQGWIAEHRLKMMQRVDEEWKQGWKVCHKDNNLRGEDGFNDLDNLVLIKCRTTKWTKFKHARVMFEPKQEKKFKAMGELKAA